MKEEKKPNFIVHRNIFLNNKKNNYHDKKRFLEAFQSTFGQEGCHQQQEHGTVPQQPYP
jgi:hypothetical protein